MKIVSGSKILNEMALEMRESAIKFYGPKYESIVKKTYNDTYAYIFDDDKNKIEDILKDIYGSLPQNIMDYYKNTPGEIKGFHLSKVSYDLLGNPEIKKYVLVKKESNYIQMIDYLVHELYGHGVCSIKKPYEKIDKTYFFRNGIAYETNDGAQICVNANEGFIELFATLITQLKYPSYELNKYIYPKAVEVAKQIYKCEGHDKVVNLLVNGKGEISRMFNPNDIGEWFKLCELLDETPSNLKSEVEIDGHIKQYVKRKKSVK